MNAAQGLLVLAAGLAAGTINTVVGSGTLITFPVLLGVGLSPLNANVSNTVGLAPGSASGAYGYRRELDGQRERTLRLGWASVFGGVLGAVLLLVLPAGAFEAVVPVLVGLGVLLVLIGPWLSQRLTSAGHRRTYEVTPLMWGLTFATGVYGGYFGAAQGVILMGIFGLLLAEDLQRINALKNVLAALANGAAAVVFAFTGHVDWLAAGLVASGAVLGGLLGARIGRQLPPIVLRLVIAVVGVIALVRLLTS